MGSFMVGQNLNPDSLSSPVFLLPHHRASFLPKCKAMRPPWTAFRRVLGSHINKQL